MKDMNMNMIINILQNEFGDHSIDNQPIKTSVVKDLARKNGVKWKNIGEFLNKYSYKRGYILIHNSDDNNEKTPQNSIPSVSQKPEKNEAQVNFAIVPEKSKTYKKFGEYNTIKKVVKSGVFMPVYIEGLSGNGKTTMVEQACAEVKQPLIRVQINEETDEDDLIGGLRLKNGDTVFEYGPMIQAMKQGAIILLDEMDRGTNKLMSLQNIMEGKPFFLKKTGEVVTPQKGFNIIATANTSGSGDADDKYVSASVLDDSLLERFAINIKQEFPSITQERNIVNSYIEENNISISEENVKFLINWSDCIRKTFKNGAINDLISTRRLLHIVQTYSILENNILNSIKYCTNKFENEVQESFLDLYQKITNEEYVYNPETGEFVSKEFDQYNNGSEDKDGSKKETYNL